MGMRGPVNTGNTYSDSRVVERIRYLLLLLKGVESEERAHARELHKAGENAEGISNNIKTSLRGKRGDFAADILRPLTMHIPCLCSLFRHRLRSRRSTYTTQASGTKRIGKERCHS